MQHRLLGAGLWTVLALILPGCATSPDAARTAALLTSTWAHCQTGSTQSLRGICAVNDRIAWTCGTGGTVLRTIDGGKNWQDVSIATAGELDFRSINALDGDTVMVLSAGSPARLYRTTNAGRYWSLVYEDTRPEIFFDTMRFADVRFGLAFSDPIDHRLPIISTNDWGRSWQQRDVMTTPQTLDGEAGFAASNSSMDIVENTVLIGLGGQTPLGKARVARSTDRGDTWIMIQTPLACSRSAGIFSVAIIDANHAVAVGGDYLDQQRATDNCIISSDGGITWKRASSRSAPRGYRSSVAPYPALGTGVVLSVGPAGLDVSTDYGKTWLPADGTPWHALDLTPDGQTMWMCGDNGRVGVYNVGQ